VSFRNELGSQVFVFRDHESVEAGEAAVNELPVLLSFMRQLSLAFQRGTRPVEV